jgi:threonine/homoserine/homoserine lactone efflux protein
MNMSEALPLFGITAALAIGTVTPGPSFLMVARTAVASGRAEGLAASVGMGIGGVTFATLALIGLHTLIERLPTLYLGFQILGGIYLIYLGTRIWRSANEPLAVSFTSASVRHLSLGRAMLLGLATQLSNPKTAVVYAAIFAAFLPQGTSLPIGIAIVVFVFLLETSWYALVTLAMSSAGPRQAYLRGKSWIDRLAGGVMMMLGLRLAWSAGVG